MKNKIYSVLLVLLAVLLVGQVSYGQTTINTTTLSAAITTPSPSVTSSSNQVILASLGSGSTSVLVGYTLFIDGEAMTVTAVPTSASLPVTVRRAVSTTRAQTHASGALVYYGPAAAFVSGTSGIQWREGSCTASQHQYLPVINILNAEIGTCSNSQWVWFKLAAPASFAGPRAVVGDAAYAAAITDYIIAYTSITAARTVTLPTATGLQGKMYIIKNENAGTSTYTIWVNATIEGSTNVGLFGSGGYQVLRLYSDGVSWFKW